MTVTPAVPPVPGLVVDLRHPRDSSEAALAALLEVPALADEIGGLFAAAGHELHLVGGPVRDLLLGRGGIDAAIDGGIVDLDFTTDATPEEIFAVAGGWADGSWDVGVRFGTVGLVKHGVRLEVTTFRTEQYDEDSRKPTVRFGDSLLEDLTRRDFTVNAMAVSVPGHVFTDPSGGLADLGHRLLRTPGTAEASFSDDPLRMLRALRFHVTVGLRLAPEVHAALHSLAGRLSIVSPERVRDELVKILLAPDPVPALELLVDTGLADVVLPELPLLRMAQESGRQHKDVYEHSLAVLRRAVERELRLPGGGPDLVVRLAALLHDVGKPETRRYDGPSGGVSFHHHETVGARQVRRRLRELRFDKATVEAVERLVRLHLRFHGYGSPGSGGTGNEPWTDSAVRRYVTDAGPLLDRLHVLVRSDCTTRNPRKARDLEAAYQALEDRIAALRQQEELAQAARPDLDGDQVQLLLGIDPSRAVGDALRFLSELKLERGPLGYAVAAQELIGWARERGIDPPTRHPTDLLPWE